MTPSRLTHRLTPSFLFFFACPSCTPVPPNTPAPLNWHPHLDQPIQQLEDLLASTDQQQPMNYTSANLAFLLDAKLYLLFDRYLSTADPSRRPALLADQRRWLTRRAHLAADARAQYQGGTLAPLAAHQAFIAATKSRITELQHRIPSP
jgi:uncharacterized protein YecT (DUF1311 family)